MSALRPLQDASRAAAVGPQGIEVRFLKKGQVVRRHVVQRDRFTIGTGEKCTLRAKADGALQPVHATVSLREGRVWIEAGPGATVVVQGREVERAWVGEDDVVRVGRLALAFAASVPQDESPITEETHQPQTDDVPMPLGDLEAPRWLQVLETSGVERWVALDRAQLVLGTGAGTASVEAVIGGEAVGERHVQLSPREDGRVVVEALHGAWPVLINGTRSEIGYAGPGDRIEVGTSIVQVSAERPDRDDGATWLRPLGMGRDVVLLRLTMGRYGLGRGADNAVVLRHAEVGRSHAQIVVDSSGTRIEELGDHPTWVSGERVGASRPLATGDRVQLPPFEVHVERAGRATRAAQPARSSVALEVPTEDLSGPAMAGAIEKTDAVPPWAPVMRSVGAPSPAQHPTFSPIDMLVRATGTDGEKGTPMVSVAQVWGEVTLAQRLVDASGVRLRTGSARGVDFFDQGEPQDLVVHDASSRGPVAVVAPGARGFVQIGGQRYPFSAMVAGGRGAGSPELGYRIPLTSDAVVVLERDGMTYVVRSSTRAAKAHSTLRDWLDLSGVFIGTTVVACAALIALWIRLAPPLPEEPAVEIPEERYVALLKAPEPPAEVKSQKSETKEEAKKDDASESKSSSKKVQRKTTTAPTSERTRKLLQSLAPPDKTSIKESVGSTGLKTQSSGPDLSAALSSLGGLPTLGTGGGGGPVVTRGSGQVGAVAKLDGGGGSGPVRASVTKLASSAKVTGSLSQEEVSRVVNANMHRIQACYEKALVASPGLAGRVVFDWTVATDGGTKDVRIRTSTIPDPKVADCITGLIRGWTFAKPAGGEVIVSYPFLFKSVAQ